MSESLHVAVVGATGAVGREIMTVLDRVKWRPETVSPVASPGTTTPFVEYGERQIPVLDAQDLDTGMLDAVILAAPDRVSREVGERAIEDGVIVVDVSGVFEGEAGVPMVVPWVNPELLAQGGIRDVVSLPGGPALLVSSILGPLARAGVVGDTDVTVFVPASTWGRDGIEELSKQVVSLFNAGTPPRKVFPQGLAFDLIPAVGHVQEDGWTDLESRARQQVQTILGAELPLRISMVGVPVFSGISAQITLRLGRRVLPDLVRRILTDGGVGVVEDDSPRTLPRPRRVEGQPFAQVGRIRADDEGATLRLWVSMDNLRGTATAAASLVGAAVRQRSA
ncbi:MAG: Asd/ArgC dimerization domain-containing protein [Myxococcota bacterium]